MQQPDAPSMLGNLLGQVVVIDFRFPYVCLGTLVGLDHEFLELRDADLHDLRDTQTTRDIYVYDSVRLGIRRNRVHLLVRRDEIVAVARLSDVAET